MIKPLLSLQKVVKNYPKIHSNRDRLRALFELLRGKHLSSSTTILKDISFDIYPGRSLAIIGENGAGKSTLLKIIAGVLKPSYGTVQLNGSIGALLELGAGFHPEYSGRENIKLSASLMGLSGQDIKNKTADIINFAEIGDYIDEPVKHYSSGMVVRLGFAIIASVAPSLLITDEVLAVGDESFQKKCIAWIENYLKQGGTLLMVSHSRYLVKKLCQEAIWIRHGQIEQYGNAHDVTESYHSFHERKSAKASQQNNTTNLKDVYSVKSITLNNHLANQPNLLELVEYAELEVSGEVYSPDGRMPGVLVGIIRIDGTPVYGTTSTNDGYKLKRMSDQYFQFKIKYFNIQLLPGSYIVRAHALDPEGMRLFDAIQIEFKVTGQSKEFGFYRIPHQWC